MMQIFMLSIVAGAATHDSPHMPANGKKSGGKLDGKIPKFYNAIYPKPSSPFRAARRLNSKMALTSS